MRIAYPDLFPVFDIAENMVNAIIIENKNAFCKFVCEFCDMVDGKDGDIVISEDYKPLKIASSADIITQFIPFNLNNRKIITKLYSYLSKKSVNADMYNDTLNINILLNDYILKLTSDENFNINKDENIDFSSLFKAVNLNFFDDYDTVCEKLFEYMINLTELDGDKLFVTVNLLSYIDKEEADIFFKTVIGHNLKLLLIESMDIEKNNNINKLIIDESFCVI